MDTLIRQYGIESASSTETHPSDPVTKNSARANVERALFVQSHLGADLLWYATSSLGFLHKLLVDYFPVPLDGVGGALSPFFRGTSSVRGDDVVVFFLFGLYSLVAQTNTFVSSLC